MADKKIWEGFVSSLYRSKIICASKFQKDSKPTDYLQKLLFYFYFSLGGGEYFVISSCPVLAIENTREIYLYNISSLNPLGIGTVPHRRTQGQKVPQYSDNPISIRLCGFSGLLGSRKVQPSVQLP